MIRQWSLPLGLMIAAACVTAPTWALDASTPAPTAAQKTQAAPAVDPSALHALDLMAQKLRTLKAFTVNADVTTEEVLDSGQKVTYGGTVTYKIRAPDKFFAAVNSDRKQRSFYYDGSKFTIYAPRMHYYAQKPMTGRVRDLVDAAQEKYGIEMPLADLFYWGTERAPLSAIQSATVIGPAHINKIECDHLLMHQGNVDWQVWIARDSLLPQKLVIANRDDPTQPEYTATFNWDTTTSLADSAFDFTPGKDDHPIKVLGDTAQSTEASP
jgi:hypothetical protein